MGWSLTRREMLKLAGGSALGMFFTPVPWKLLGDSAIWTQNWPAIARPGRGEITFRQGACSLCPVGCALRARCVAGVPVRLTGVAADPAGGGALCPIGLAGHQLPWHPARVKSPRRRQRSGGARTGPWNDVTLEAAVALAAGTLRDRRPGEMVVILDDRPGRVRSEVYRAFAEAVPSGACVSSPGRVSRPLETLASLFATPPDGPIGLDPLKAEAILTFGAPLLDGHGGPGLSAALIRGRRAGGRPEIVCAEPHLSRTASMADRWLPIRPGTEVPLALGLAHVLLRDGLLNETALRREALDLEKYRRMANAWTPAATASSTGLEPRQVEETAWSLARRPVLVVAGDPATGPASREDDTIILGLNLLLGAGRDDRLLTAGGGPLPEVLNGAAPPARATELERIPDRSVRLLILDASDAGGTLSWSALSRKLVPGGGLVVSLSPWCVGLSRHADLIVPAPAALENCDEMTGPESPAAGSWKVALPLLESPEGALDPIDFVRRLAASSGHPLTGDAGAAAATDLMKRRAVLLFTAGRGRTIALPDGEARDVASLATPDELWETLAAGGVWVGESGRPLPRSYRLLGGSPERVKTAAAPPTTDDRKAPGSRPLVASSIGWSASRGAGAVAPLLTKLYQESALRESSPEALIHPATARALGLAGGSAVRVDTSGGTVRRRLRLSTGVRPGTVQLALGPDSPKIMESAPAPAADAADLFSTGDPSAPRALPARIGKV